MELADRIQRTGSFCEADPQEQLVKLFQKRNLDKFCKLLSSNQVNVNHYYGDPEHGTILDLCALQDDRSQFMDQVLKHGAEPNAINRLRKKAPIHFTIERNDLKNLACLLKCSNLDVNICDSFGNTPLHYAAKGSTKDGSQVTTALQMLLTKPNINVNSINRKGQCPAYLAASQGNKNALLLLVYREDIDLELNLLGKSLREMIQEKYDDILLSNRLVSSLPQIVTAEYIFSLLRARNTDSFKKALEENRDLKDASDGLFTLLQYACNRGLFKEAELLIELGADVNKTNNSSQYTPIMMALKKGYYRIAERLIKSEADLFFCPVNKENVYHCVVVGSIESGELGDLSDGRDHIECLNTLISNAALFELINQGDFKGNTPLHYAGRIGSDEMVLRLLEAGAYAGCVNNFGDPALSYISPSLFERYLDKCVKTNDKLPREERYEIIINYKCFMPPFGSSLKDTSSKAKHLQNGRLSSNLNETDLLLYTSNSPDMQHLLMHPVLKSLIFVKWYNIRKLFYVNLLFYVLFCALLSVYILVFYDDLDPNQSFHNETNLTEDLPVTKETNGFIWYLITLLLFLLILRELFQFKKSYVNYLKDLENWLEVGLILLTITILFVNVGEETKHQLAASAILLSWVELVLLIGKHPSLSTQTEMLKTVGFSFFEFFSWYWILIMAFALSFYTLFRNGHESDEENQVFRGPGVSVFKTIVMLTGEFDTGDIPFNRFPITGHLLFILFVFTIAIVLYNLLNGLAVSDTQAIKSNAEMVGYKSRIKLVSYVETIDVYSCKKLFSGFKSCDYSKGNLASKSLSFNRTVYSFTVDPEIHIFPNDRNKFEFSSAPSRHNRTIGDDPQSCCLINSCNCKDTVMDSTIVKAAQSLLSKRLEASNSYGDFKCLNLPDKLLNEFMRTLQEYKNVLQSMKETEKRILSLTQNMNDNQPVSLQSFHPTEQ